MESQSCHKHIHTSCGWLTLELEELSFHFGELVLQGLHGLSVLVLQMSDLVSEAVTECFILGCQLAHCLGVFRLHHSVLGLN